MRWVGGTAGQTVGDRLPGKAIAAGAPMMAGGGGAGGVEAPALDAARAVRSAISSSECWHGQPRVGGRDGHWVRPKTTPTPGLGVLQCRISISGFCMLKKTTFLVAELVVVLLVGVL